MTLQRINHISTHLFLLLLCSPTCYFPVRSKLLRAFSSLSFYFLFLFSFILEIYIHLEEALFYFIKSRQVIFTSNNPLFNNWLQLKCKSMKKNVSKVVIVQNYPCQIVILLCYIICLVLLMHECTIFTALLFGSLIYDKGPFTDLNLL